MITTATYSHYYSLSMVDPRTLASYPNLSANVASTTLTDDKDGDPDGTVAVNEDVSWTASGNAVLIGVTDAGYPVLEDTGFFYILTDRGDLHNTPLVVNNAGYTMCFAAGTMIAAASGEHAVETLQIGDLVVTADGREVAVKWVGRQTLNKFLHRERVQMVRIKEGALGRGRPHLDLIVTGDHGLVLGGYVINASALVNGDTIGWIPLDELPTSFTVYHIETQQHDIILANGAPSETFVDVATRQGFDNYQEYLDLYGLERIIAEMNAPRIASTRLVPWSLLDHLRPDTEIKKTA